MAVYKVPQDVEADDKLIGPFSFRQFMYLLIVAASLAIAFFLSRLFLPLLVLPLPIVLFFGALALPLRKDQPMETYLAAIVSFYLKPRRRLWSPDGTENIVEITVPKTIEVQRTKDLSVAEAEQRLSYLASIVDTRGWAVRGVDAQMPHASNAMNTDVFNEAQQTQDILDTDGVVGQSVSAKLSQATDKQHKEMLARVQQPATQQTPPPDPYQNMAVTPQTDDPTTDQQIQYNPYPTMHQSVLAPIDPNTPAPTTPAQKPEEKKPSAKEVSPDIINLANNADLSVETIAREANRIQHKQELSDDEVVISLR